jgi:hypothetical protein
VKQSASCLFWVLVVGAFVATPSGLAETQTTIANSGTSTVRATVEGKEIIGVIHTIRIDRNSDAFPSIDWDAKAVTVVRKLELSVGGKRIFVPRSVFTDLLDPRSASIRSQKGAFILTIAGGDGAESYFVHIHFDTTNVTRRTLYSSLTPSTPTADTHYRLTVLKDE